MREKKTWVYALEVLVFPPSFVLYYVMFVVGYFAKIAKEGFLRGMGSLTPRNVQ